MAGTPQAGCRIAGAACAAAATLWLAASAAQAGEIDRRQLTAAFDLCLADPRIASAKEHPESIQWNQPPAPKAKKKKRKKRGAETTLRDDLRLFCPELFAEINRSSFALLLPDDWGERVTPRKLQRLRELMMPEAENTPARRLDTAVVPGILDELHGAQAAKELSLWQRFKSWLADILEKKSGKSESGWLSKWLDEHRLSDEVMSWIGYGLLILLVAGAGWVVYVELRAAGMLGGRMRRRASHVGAPGAAAARPGMTLAEAGEEEQPALLIALLLEQMRRLGRIQDRLSMTHRELAAAASFDSSGDRDIFSALIGVAEKLRYSAIAPARAQLRKAIESAKVLLSRLLQPPRSAV